jgi:hypothetical protein
MRWWDTPLCDSVAMAFCLDLLRRALLCCAVLCCAVLCCAALAIF